MPEEYFEQPEEAEEPEEVLPAEDVEEMNIPEQLPEEEEEVNLVTEDHSELENLLNEINNSAEEAIEEIEEAVEETVEEVEEVIEEENIFEKAEPIEQIDVATSDLDTLDEASIESIINEVMEGNKEYEEPVAEEAPVEEVREPEPVKIDVPEEEIPAEEPEEEEIVDDSFEEVPVVEKEETVKDIVPEYNPFPHLTENKVKSIKDKVSVMLNVVSPCREVELLHYVIFGNKNDFNAYRAIAFGLGYEIENEINDNGEVYLSNTVVADKDKLNHSILTLADTLSAYKGTYKGWKVKDIIE